LVRASLLVFGVFLILMIFHFLKKPTHNREWRADNEYLSEVKLEEDLATISHVRDWRYDPEGPISQNWLPKTYNLSLLEDTWFIMEQFSDREAVGHAMLMFDFSDGQTVLISVEARKEKDETFSAWKGIWREFELNCIWGTQEDFLVRRSIVQHHPLRVHRLNLQKSTQRSLFRALAKKTNGVKAKPQFYHTLLHNCTNELAYAANDANPGSVPFSKSRILTGYADKTLFDRGLIYKNGDWKTHRNSAYVHDFIKANYMTADWTQRLREKLSSN